MIKQHFIEKAIEKGWKDNSFVCEGWDWIRSNLHELDYIFQTKEYRECNGRKYKCMPLLIGGDILTHEEERLLETAWYLNNERKQQEKQKSHTLKMQIDGWLPLTKEIVRQAFTDKKKLLLSASSNNDWMTVKIDRIYKPFIFNKGTDREQVGLMDKLSRTRGYLLSQFENAFCKII